MEKVKRIFYGVLLAACVCIPLLAIGNFFAIYNVIPFLVTYVLVNWIVVAIIALKGKRIASWISYVVVAFLLYPQFLFLWIVIFGCAFGACLSI
jgi:hypothetical protein